MRSTGFTPLIVTLALCLNALPALAQQSTQPADDSRRDASRGEMYRGDYRNSDSDYPAAEVQSIPAARANAVRSRLEMELIQTNMHRWVERAWDDFLTSKDYLTAAGDERKAQDAYAHERDRVLKRLADDSSYKALNDLIKDLRDKIDAERDRPKSLAYTSNDVLDNMMAMATLKLSYATALSAMESAALSADHAVQDARGKLVDAGAKTREMRRGFDHGVRRDPEFLAGRTRYEEARINHIVAGAYLESAVNARDIALDYAYYVHRWDQYKYTTQYSDYPYYGGGYGYTRRY